MLTGALAAMAIVAVVPDAITREPSPRAIIGGEPTEPGEFPSVVAVVVDNFLCTGTVIAESLVLTAGHCFKDDPDPSDVIIAYGGEISGDRLAPTAGYGVHPDYTGDLESTDIFDYAYVVVDARFTFADGFVRPLVEQAEWDEVMRVGAPVTVVGYGRESNDLDAIDGRKRKVDTTISNITRSGTEFFAGGDGFDSCQGDSGGPAFVHLADGTRRLAGVLSRGSNPCGDGAYYGNAYAPLAWIREETGVDLLPAHCDAADGGDCLDTRQPDDGGCRVAGRTPLPSFLLVIIAALLRRRR